MKRTIFAAILIALCATGCKEGGLRLRNETDSLSYVIGMSVGENLFKMDSTLNVQALCAAISDTYRGRTQLTRDEAKIYYLRYATYGKHERVKAMEEQFLEDMRKGDRKYVRTASGLTYKIGTLGSQERTIADRDTILLRYTLRSQDGKVLYSSYEQKDTLRTAVRDLVQGVRECVKIIGEGGTAEAWLPAATGYGSEGDQTLGVAPNATLHYELELVELRPYNSQRQQVRRTATF